MQIVLTPDIIRAAYAQGIFPMAEHANSAYVHWYCPKYRGQLSIPDLRIPKSVRRALKSGAFDIRINTAFAQVINACAAQTDGRPQTWINPAIAKVFCDLHIQGDAHSVECWAGHTLVGGLYGLALGGAFFGESMFSRTPEASKVALVHLVARLWRGGFTLLDTQFVNPHLKQFGAYEIAYPNYMAALAPALALQRQFRWPADSQTEIMHDYAAFRGLSLN